MVQFKIYIVKKDGTEELRMMNVAKGVGMYQFAEEIQDLDPKLPRGLVFSWKTQEGETVVFNSDNELKLAIGARNKTKSIYVRPSNVR